MSGSLLILAMLLGPGRMLMRSLSTEPISPNCALMNVVPREVEGQRVRHATLLSISISGTVGEPRRVIVMKRRQ